MNRRDEFAIRIFEIFGPFARAAYMAKDECVNEMWMYADLMEAEAKKRDEQDRPQPPLAPDYQRRVKLTPGEWLQ